MSRIILSSKQRVVDHSYHLARDILDAIEWFDDETLEYGWQVRDTTKNEYVERKDISYPGQLQIVRK